MASLVAIRLDMAAAKLEVAAAELVVEMAVAIGWRVYADRVEEGGMARAKSAHKLPSGTGCVCSDCAECRRSVRASVGEREKQCTNKLLPPHADVVGEEEGGERCTIWVTK